MDEGYIKFRCNWIEEDYIHPEQILELNQWRQQLYDHGLIGMYADGIGYGNISMRVDQQTFIISGSATGGMKQLGAAEFAIVTDCEIDRNTITCRGRILASSESMTHAAIYACSPEINAVLHVHHREMWLHGLSTWPSTSAQIAYGTPEMARAVQELCQTPALQQQKIMAMAGHEDGIVCFGKTLEEAGMLMLDQFRQIQMR